MMFRFTDFSLQLNYEIYFNYIMKTLFHFSLLMVYLLTYVVTVGVKLK